MTPEEWFAATDPHPLLALVNPPLAPLESFPALVESVRERLSPRQQATTRRLRLFAVACARQVWDLLPTDARSAVYVAERFADNLATETDLAAAAIRHPPPSITFQQHALSSAYYASWRHLLPDSAARSAAKALATRAIGPAPLGRPTTQKWHNTWTAAFNAARATQADYVRDIFPPPGITPRLDRDWLTSTVVAIARQMDQSGDFSAVPILADALQDAGCDSEAVLQCCRAPGNNHVRGNWVVDLVLGL
jgi:hypothetical protein